MAKRTVSLNWSESLSGRKVRKWGQCEQTTLKKFIIQYKERPLNPFFTNFTPQASGTLCFLSFTFIIPKQPGRGHLLARGSVSTSAGAHASQDLKSPGSESTFSSLLHRFLCWVTPPTSSPRPAPPSPRSATLQRLSGVVIQLLYWLEFTQLFPLSPLTGLLPTS